ncbi:MAG TPA: hypothetical protein VK050_11375 [Flavobacteriaceae bacterium]|nr:hypothetical protein [Flavobacteriaceae bacterium]
MTTALEQIGVYRNKVGEEALSTDFVLNWLQEHWELYLAKADDNSCTFRKSPFPCFCYERKEDCLFVAIYTKLSVLENYASYNKQSALLLAEYERIKSKSVAVEQWLKRNMDFALDSLSPFHNYEGNRVIRRSFIHGKNMVSRDFDYIFLYVSLDMFAANYEDTIP